MKLNVTKLPTSVYVKEIEPSKFKTMICDCGKRDFKGAPNYFNLGFFAEDIKKTVTIGNVVGEGTVYSDASLTADWINLAKKSLTTIYTTTSGACGIIKTGSIKRVPRCKNAISGIPIIRNGSKVSMTTITKEGYFGNEVYKTWHGFLGIRNNKLVYVGADCDFDQMYPFMVALGINNAIKLDGGGSFILEENNKLLQATSGNRRINSVGVWE